LDIVQPKLTPFECWLTGTILEAVMPTVRVMC
jgi:hypothetical protein